MYTIKENILKHSKYSVMTSILCFAIMVFETFEGLIITKGTGKSYERAKFMVIEFLKDNNIDNINPEEIAKMCGLLIAAIGFIMSIYIGVCIVYNFKIINEKYSKKKFKKAVILKFIFVITSIFYYSSTLITVFSVVSIIKLTPFLFVMLFTYMEWYMLRQECRNLE